MMTQVIFRLVTFFMNAFVLRYISRDVLALICVCLNLLDSIRPVTYSHPSSTNRMILVNNKLPNSSKSLFYTLPPFSRPLAKTAFTDLFTSRVKV